MVYQRKLIISESERNQILGLYENKPSFDFVISDWMSPDEKFVIFLDELYDIENKVKLGNVFENFELFKDFLYHSFEVSTTVTKEIKESIMTSIKSLVITESNRNVTHLKTTIKEQLNEGVGDDLLNWGKETVSSAINGVSDFVKTGIEGAKKLYKGISDGDWNSIIDLIKKGSLYVARKIRSALYNPIGLILDAILIAIGVGKSVQFVIWAIVVGLDIYEFISGNYEDPELNMIWRLFFFGIDVVGMVVAGAAAKTSKTMVGALIRKFGKGADGVTMAVKSNPAFKQLLETMLSKAGSAKGYMENALKYLQKSSPMMYKFLSGIMNGLGKFIQMLITTITTILKGLTLPGKLVSKVVGTGKIGKASSAAANILVPTAAIGTYVKNKERKNYEDITNSLSSNDVKPEFSEDDL